MPTPGKNIRATAAIVVDEVSKRWSMPSVAQNPSNVSEMASNRFSDVFIGPSSASDLRIASRPPGTSSTSGRIIRVMTKYSATDMRTAKGAAATNHSSQVMDFWRVLSMKPIATMFCAAAVLIPTFQILAVCVVVIISMPANAPFLLTPKAVMMPSVMGTRQATRAVVEGTKNAMTNPTRIAPTMT